MVIRSDLDATWEVEQRVLAEAARHGYSDCAAFALRLAAEEALNNAIRHGNRCDPQKDVAIELDIDARRARVVITDQGEGFDPDAVPDPTADENLEKPRGRGIMLMRAYMDEVRFARGGSQVRMVKYNA